MTGGWEWRWWHWCATKRPLPSRYGPPTILHHSGDNWDDDYVDEYDDYDDNDNDEEDENDDNSVDNADTGGDNEDAQLISLYYKNGIRDTCSIADCCPLLSIGIHCCPLLSIVVHCCYPLRIS